jgi:hypothetical protein
MECGADDSDLGSAEKHAGGTGFTPGAGAGGEDMGGGLQEGLLLLGSEFDHAMVIVGIAEGGENLAAKPEIGMSHVGGFHSAGDLQGEGTEFSWGEHGVKVMEYFKLPGSLMLKNACFSRFVPPAGRDARIGEKGKLARQSREFSVFPDSDWARGLAFLIPVPSVC